jgi:DNA-binding transcriptional MerR regulator
MLKIGEFSRLSQVTVKTLHHYNDLGLLQPAEIDPFTSYRYYSLDQLPRIHRIMALKEMGLSLEQISLMLTEEISTDEIRGMLRLKQAEIQQSLREEQKRLSLVDFRLHMIDAETNFPELDVVLKRIEPQRVLSIYVGRQHKMGPTLESVKQAVQDGTIHFDGIAIDVFHGDEVMELESPQLGDNQHEVLIPVKETQPGDVTLENIGRLTLRQTAVIETAATLMLHGINHDERYKSAALLRRWGIAHGYRLQNELRYVHHRGPLETFDRTDWITEIQLVVNAHD